MAAESSTTADSSVTPTLIYIHGFNSSPDSDKARQTRAWLATNRPDIDFICPFLSPFPAVAMAQLEALIADLSDTLYFVGSSMGGFYSTPGGGKWWEQYASMLKPGLVQAVAPYLSDESS